MIFKETSLNGAFLISLEKREDERGFFARYYCENEFKKAGLNTTWSQVNNSLSVSRGTLRGLHFQKPPFSEVKLVRCISGAIWDVIVDIRIDSKTYGKWFAAELTAENRNMLYVPKGFAHGFISLKDNTEIIYMVSDPYNPQYESTLRWDDSFHKIDWPFTPTIISEKDKEVADWNDNNGILL